MIIRNLSYKHYRTMHSQLFILLQLLTFGKLLLPIKRNFFGCGKHILIYRLFIEMKPIEGLDKAKEIF